AGLLGQLVAWLPGLLAAAGLLGRLAAAGLLGALVVGGVSGGGPPLPLITGIAPDCAPLGPAPLRNCPLLPRDLASVIAPRSRSAVSPESSFARMPVGVSAPYPGRARPIPIR